MYCPNCNKEIRDPEAEFCPECGERLELYAPGERGRKRLRYEDGGQEEKDRGGFPFLIIPILLAAALALFLLMNDGIRKRLFGEHVVEDINQEEARQEEEETLTQVEVVNQGEPEVVHQGEPAEEEEEEAPAEEPLPEEPQEEEPEEEPEPDREEREEEVIPTNGQIFPDSSSRYLSDGEIGSLNLSQSQYAINEIYARHGYIFGTEPYKSYYQGLSWYHGTIPADQFSESIFNDIEYDNIEKLGAHRNALAGQQE